MREQAGVGELIVVALNDHRISRAIQLKEIVIMSAVSDGQRLLSHPIVWQPSGHPVRVGDGVRLSKRRWAKRSEEYALVQDHHEARHAPRPDTFISRRHHSYSSSARAVGGPVPGKAGGGPPDLDPARSAQ